MSSARLTDRHRMWIVPLAGLITFACAIEPDVEWRHYGGDQASTKYSPVDQIDAENFGELGIAWVSSSPAGRWKRAFNRRVAEGQEPPFKVSAKLDIRNFQATPLMIDGVLYGISPIGQVFALDAGSGATKWVHDPGSYRSSLRLLDFQFAKHRGVSYWRDGDDARILVPTIDAYLLALDAETGQPVDGFGEGGRLDLLEGLRGPPARRLVDYYQSSPAVIFEDLVIVGGSVTDRPRTPHDIPGDVRAYDVRSGALVWVFHMVPAEGEFGTESWGDDSWRHSGGGNAWGLMSVDPELGTVYIPTSTVTNDLYGGHRPGDNLFGESLLCLDARTGERVWHYQVVRHGLWDYDLSAAPNLVDIEVGGRRISAVAQATKQGFVFVFDRRTGEPVWPIVDRAVPDSDVPGERASKTQPFPTRPPPFERLGTFEEDLIDFTPELRAQALAEFRRFRTGPLFTPPSLRGTLILPGSSGGANWYGAGFDPATGVLYVPSKTMPTVMVVEPGEPESGFDYVTRSNQGLYLPGDIPLFKPPFSRITAIDLNRGEISWQVPNGDGPRDRPLLEPLDLPPLGSGTHACVLVTPTLVFAAEGAEIWKPQMARPIFRAFDKRSGEVVGAIELPARVRGCPMTYRYRGVQYIVMPIADADRPPVLVALTLGGRTSPGSRP